MRSLSPLLASLLLASACGNQPTSSTADMAGVGADMDAPADDMASSSCSGTVSTALTMLSTSAGSACPAFAPGTLTYLVSVDPSAVSAGLTPVAQDDCAAIEIDGKPATGGVPSTIALSSGLTRVSVRVSHGADATTYTVVFVRSGTQSAYLKASNSESSDEFGDAISLSGDTLAVGARSESSDAVGIGGNQASNGATKAGAVYVFVRSGTTWTQQAYLKASNPNANDLFGSYVALSDDTLAVGAPSEASNATGIGGDQSNNAAPSSGAVYVFVRNGTTWSQQAYIKASNTGMNDQFGARVALAGDTLAVGAAREASNATGVNNDQSNNSVANAGAVYVFVRSGTTWTQQAYLKASNTGANDFFGNMLALSGETLAVGASRESSKATGVNGDQSDDTAAKSGAVYVFVRSGTVWTQQAYLKASNTDAEDQFGGALALSGDTLAAGAYGESSNATGIGGDQTNNAAPSSGAVYIFQRSGTSWAQQAYLKAFNTGEQDAFGTSVALEGDRLVVGAITEGANVAGAICKPAAGSGAVYVFERSGSTWTQRDYLKASNADVNDNLGWPVALSGNLVAIGAVNEDSNASGVGGNTADNSAAESGAVYVFTP